MTLVAPLELCIAKALEHRLEVCVARVEGLELDLPPYPAETP